MGLYDGDGSSTAAVAETLGLPVVLVVDASAGMESVAATALGFRAYADRIGRGIDVVGVIAQRAHGGRHADGIREALPDDLTYFGRIPPNDDPRGTRPPPRPTHGRRVARARRRARRGRGGLRTERLVDISREPAGALEPATAVESTDGDRPALRSPATTPSGSYPATIERLRERATVEPFAPIAGRFPPAL